MVSYSYNKFKSSNSIRLNNYLYSKIAVAWRYTTRIFYSVSQCFFSSLKQNYHKTLKKNIKC